MVIFDNQTWLINQVMGPWDEAGWNEVILCLQNDRVLTEEEEEFESIPIVMG